jgi:uncharacterized iron-regulated membrane protein
MRAALVRLHRWLGLAMAGFLVVAGLTGSVIAFNHELDEWLNPELFEARSAGEPLSPFELAARIEREDPRARVTYFALAAELGRAAVFSVSGKLDPATGAPRKLGYNQVFFDPVTGERLGQRDWGAARLNRAHLIPFLYALHYTLHLPERWGMWLMGSVAVLWLLDCFVALGLTLPPRRAYWKVKRGASGYRLGFDLHRAGGLWLWGLLLVIALSAVYLNLQYEVFRPALGAIAKITPSPIEVAATRQRTADAEPRVSYAEVVATAREAARQRGWVEPFDAFYSQELGAYGVGFGDHHAPGLGVPWMYFGEDGSMLAWTAPGEGTSGDVFMQWLLPLHTGNIIGLPGRILVSLLGLAVAVLSVTGVIIWQRKRRASVAAQHAQRVQTAI